MGQGSFYWFPAIRDPLWLYYDLFQGRNFPSPTPESRDERLNDYFSNILCVNDSL